jgi:hypothetical protein
LKPFYNYLVATGFSVGYVWVYYQLEMQDLHGHNRGYTILTCFLMGIFLAGTNCLFFIPRNWVKIRYLLPGIFTLSVLLIFSMYADVQIGAVFTFLYVPFLINAGWGIIFYYVEQRQ